MNDLFDERSDGPTLLSTEEREALIPSYITTRNELNEAEQANIIEAQGWALQQKT